jgi:hypothetical protein
MALSLTSEGSEDFSEEAPLEEMEEEEVGGEIREDGD